MMEYSEKKVNLTEFAYQSTRVVVTPYLKKHFNPIILNKDFIPKDGRGIIYAPNHRSTLDPFAVTTGIEDTIHWAALKRFFDAEDSIFNNSKNPLLCQLTKYMFKTLGFIPIDREAANLEALRLISKFLKDCRNIGIFPEGTTNKHPDQYDLGEVKPGLSIIARKNDAWIQPISLVWIKDKRIANRVIINFREPFLSTGNKKGITDLWTSEVQEGIRQNKELISNLTQVADASEGKRISLQIK